MIAGTRLGPFEVVSALGEGGMGEVYRAADTKLGREVAIKVLPAAFAEDPERLARFEREARLLAALNHPNIAHVYGFETATPEDGPSVHFLAMELVEGEDLSERLKRGPLPLDEAIAVARQIAEALEAAHEKGIVHRDLKPANVKLTPDGVVKVLDFGLAKAMDPPAAGASAADLARSPTLMNSPTMTAAQGTQLGVILGTAAYMSPEQARGQAVDKRADIWAFGVVLLEMLTGRRPFEGETVSDVLAAVLRKEIDLGGLPPTTPPEVRHLLETCLERNPKNRLRDVGDARIALDEAMRGPGATRPGESIAASPRASRREWATRAAAGLSAIAAVSLGTFSLRHAGAPAAPRYEKLSFARQFISNARFAVDGRTVVLSAAREGNRSELFVRHPGDPRPRALGQADVQLLAVSSKGELALLTRARYRSHRTYLGTLARMPLAEASPREVMNDVTAADWSPDGAELAVVRRVGGKSRLEFPIGKLLAESPGYLSDVRVSPKGDHVAFMRHAFDLDNRGSVVIVNRAGAVVATSPGYWGLEGQAWSAEGRSVYFSALDVDHEPDYAVRELGLDGAIRTILAAPTGLILHDAAPDGRLLVSTHLERGDVVAFFPGTPSERDLSWLDSSYQPVMSRDGRSLLFGDSSELSGNLYSIFYRASADSPPVRLGEGTGTDLSPDGTLVVAIVMSAPPRLMIYPTGAGEARDISAANLVAYELSAHFFRNGASVAYCGTEAGKTSRCWALDLAGGPARAVTPEGTSGGRMSPDGTAVVARRADGRYERFPLPGGEGTPVPGLEPGDAVLGWSADGRSLVVYRPADIPARVDRLDLATGTRTLLKELAPTDRAGVVHISAISFSADGSAYAYAVTRIVGTLYAVEGVR